MNNTVGFAESVHSPIPDRRQIILMVSQACNLDCEYCYQSKKSKGIMSVVTAKCILEDEFAKMLNDDWTTRAEIAYMGGEPLLNFDLIREVSEWLWSKEQAIPFELTVRTNGTLLSGDMELWLSANKSRIDVGLSMDGLSTMNKFNRTDQFINWKFFRENWPSRRIKLVLFKDSVYLLAETIREMNRTGIPFETEIGEGFEWTPETAGVLENQLLSLIPEYMDQPEEAVNCGLFSFRIADYFPEYPMRDIAFCGESNNIIAYDVDGSPCICHVFSTPVLGYEKARWAWDNLREIKSIPFDPTCTKCPIHKNCKNCFGESMRLGGTIYRSAAKTTICNAMKAKARACSLFFLKRVGRKIANNEYLSQDDQEYAEKALRLLEIIPSFIES
ncbi:MAG TPA: hypothetical protein DDW65_07050 [Firmicutes bacterium]|jgi:uncharacterized protein|nr:hypothetical protein [Bacillota bacterium]